MILTVSVVRRVSMCHHTKFRSDRLNHCWDMAILRFFEMAADAVLVFKISKF